MDLTLKSLLVPLPEDIQKLKGYGAFKEAMRLIDLRLQESLPTMVKERLVLERVILSRIPEQYPHSEDEALRILQTMFEDVTRADLEAAREADAADWYFIDGEVFYKDDFVDNLMKTRASWAKRVKPDQRRDDKEGNFSMLDDIVQRMKRDRGAAYRMTIEMGLKINPEIAAGDNVLSVHLPLPIAYRQVKQVEILEISPQPKHIGEALHPQRTVFFSGKFSPEQAFRVRFRCENHSRYIEPDPDLVSPLQPSFYTEEFPPHLTFTPLIQSVSREIVGGEKNPLIKARKIYDFMTEEIIYSFMRPYITLTNIPEYCLTSRKGDCGVLALTFIALCRAAGVPARWQSGLYANPLSIGNHDWAEFYVEPFGWIFVDPSFGGSAYRQGNKARHAFYQTNLDPFRIPFASAFQYPMYPALKYLRNDPYDNQNGEAEYEDRPLYGQDRITRSTLLEIEPIDFVGEKNENNETGIS